MKFTINLDKKYTVWQNLTIEIEAKDETEAKMLAKSTYLPRNTEYLFSETLYDTEMPVSKEENGGEEVVEIKEISAN